MTSFSSDLILERLRALHPRAIDLSLARIERLLAALGHPEQNLAPVVHIAGTNGKGSTLAMLDAMLQSDGRRVQRYISPHLVHFNERFLFDGQPIGEPELAEVLEHCERINLGLPITEFEITTAAAFLAFARRPADALLIETGLGGRLDATNVIARPRLTALAPISLDHQSFLGEHLAQIAFEKAGILKPEVPCIVGPQPAEALAVIEARAAEIGAPLQVHGRDWRARREADRLLVESGGPHARSAAARARRRASDRQCRARGDLCAGASRPRAGPGRHRRGPAQREVARPPAAPGARAPWSTCCRPAARSGSTADTTQVRPRRWPKASRTPIRGPGTWSLAC